MYSVAFERAALREFLHLQPEIRLRIQDAVTALQEEPRPRGCVKLAGVEAWRIRVGSYRVIYAIDDAQQTVTIEGVRRHRSGAYRS
jgi:mRNA interferase RelE/StbE